MGDETAGATVVVVVFFWCVVLPAPVCAWECWCAGAGAVVVTVVAVPDFFLGGFECSPVTISTAMRTATTATAASGPPSRRGRRLIECMTGSSTPVMKVRASDALSSSNSTGSDGLGTGGGGTGGTMAWLGSSVRRTADEPDTPECAGRERRLALPVVLPALGSRGGVRAELFEGVQPLVVVLDGVLVVLGASAHDDGRDQAHDDHGS